MWKRVRYSREVNPCSGNATIAGMCMTGPKLPEDLGERVDELGADGWELDRAVPILSKGWAFFGGSYTESLLLFFRRARGE